MSYILDALRKSETERRQGRVPDLGHQVQFIHKPKQKSLSTGNWIAIGLLLNALAVGFGLWIWLPDSDTGLPEPTAKVVETGPVERVEPEPVPPQQIPVIPEPAAATGEVVAEEEAPLVIHPSNQEPELITPTEPTLIVPSGPQIVPLEQQNDSPAGIDLPARIPHLVELPLSFQRQVPNLTFNSHVFSTQASSSRVMINGNYLRIGDQFSGIRVEKITEDGVVLSRDGRVFRVGVVRDWVSPR